MHAIISLRFSTTRSISNLLKTLQWDSASSITLNYWHHPRCRRKSHKPTGSIGTFTVLSNRQVFRLHLIQPCQFHQLSAKGSIGKADQTCKDMGRGICESWGEAKILVKGTYLYKRISSFLVKQQSNILWNVPMSVRVLTKKYVWNTSSNILKWIECATLEWSKLITQERATWSARELQLRNLARSMDSCRVDHVFRIVRPYTCQNAQREYTACCIQSQDLAIWSRPLNILGLDYNEVHCPWNFWDETSPLGKSLLYHQKRQFYGIVGDQFPPEKDSVFIFSNGKM